VYKKASITGESTKKTFVESFYVFTSNLVTSSVVKCSQIIATDRHLCMLRPQRLPQYRQRPLIE
jgi:hypothetical protein